MPQFKSLILGTLAFAQHHVVLAALGGPAAPPTYDPTKPGGEVSLANCVVDVGVSAIFLGKAGLGINAAVQTCTKNPLYSSRRRHLFHRRRRVPNITPMESASCSASVSGLISAFLYSTSFAALAAADCEKSLKIPDEKIVKDAMCAADVNFVIGGMALIAQAGSEIYRTCPGPLTKKFRGETWGNYLSAGFKGDDAIADDSVRRLSELKDRYFTEKSLEALMDAGELNGTKVFEALEVANRKLARFVPEAANFSSQAAEAREARRLQALPTPPPTQSVAFKVVESIRNRHAEEAECAFDVGQATFFLARASLMVNAAVQDCSSAHLFEGGNKAKAVCSVDVTSIIGAFSFVASGISYAVFHCPQWKIGTDAACAGSIINIVSALAEVAAAGSNFDASCKAAVVKPSPTEAPKKARRLEETNSQVV